MSPLVPALDPLSLSALAGETASTSLFTGTLATLAGDGSIVSDVPPLLFDVELPKFEWLADLVAHATGWAGLGLIALYSFLIAFVLPLPSEVVLVPVTTGTLSLGLPTAAEYVVVMVISGGGKALGSVFAFHIGQEAKEAGPVIRLLKRSRFDVVEWSEKKTVELAKKYGYAGLAMALSVPFFPDTLSIYAFAVLEEDYFKFAAATFAGSVGRLVVTILLAVFGLYSTEAVTAFA